MGEIPVEVGLALLATRQRLMFLFQANSDTLSAHVALDDMSHFNLPGSWVQEHRLALPLKRLSTIKASRRAFSKDSFGTTGRPPSQTAGLRTGTVTSSGTSFGTCVRPSIHASTMSAHSWSMCRRGPAYSALL